MDFRKSLTVELLPVILVGIMTGVVSGFGAYMAVKTDMTIVQVNQSNIIEKLEGVESKYEKVLDVQYMQGVRVALLEDREDR